MKKGSIIEPVTLIILFLKQKIHQKNVCYSINNSLVAAVKKYLFELRLIHQKNSLHKHYNEERYYYIKIFKH